MRVILASQSPRRKQLLAEICGQFEILVADGEEIHKSTEPKEIVCELAQAKGRAVVAAHPDLQDEDTLVISADTIVVSNGDILGKPKDEADAFRMLRRLSGREHTVFTGVCLLCGDKTTVFYDASLVKMKELSDEEILAYVASGSPMDKAGAYGMQDDCVVESFSGSASNIIGLPVEKLTDMLKKEGYYGKI